MSKSAYALPYSFETKFMFNLHYAGLLGSGSNYRSAISGLFVTKGFAQKHPNTTVKEKKSKIVFLVKKGK
jgi:hypothetical protein